MGAQKGAVYNDVVSDFFFRLLGLAGCTSSSSAAFRRLRMNRNKTTATIITTTTTITSIQVMSEPDFARFIV